MAETGQMKVEKQIVLPMFKAIQMSYQSIQIRLGRSIITIMGISFAIAFLTSIFSSIAINGALLTKGPEYLQARLSGGVGIKAQQIWLMSLSLLVCVVGITNAMLMSVTERYREIGTMKCLGALDSFIVKLFLIESAFQGIIGAVAGVIIGNLSMILISLIKYGGIIWKVFPWLSIIKTGMIAIFFGVILTIVGAIYPAYRAAKMVPADAMRKDE